MSNAPDFEEKARELWYSLRTDTVQAVPAIAAALRREREDALERAAQTVEKRAVLYDADMANSLRVAASYIRALASPAAAPAAEPCPFGGCVNDAPPSEPAAPEKKPFACGADIERDGHLYRCDRGAGHTGSHGERDYAEWTDAEHHDAEPVAPAPSLLPRVLAALESRPDGYVLHCLVLELRRYIAGVEAPGQCGDRSDCDAAHKRIAELEAAIRWALGEGDGFPTRQPGQGWYWWRTELRRRAKLQARTATRSEGKGK